jgi:hypothetical protein
MAERTRIPPMLETEASTLSRLYEATAPPVGTPLSSPIALRPVKSDCKETEAFLLSLRNNIPFAEDEDVSSFPSSSTSSSSSIILENILVLRANLPQKPESIIAFVTPSTASVVEIEKRCHAALHSYQRPLIIHAMNQFPLRKASKQGNPPPAGVSPQDKASLYDVESMLAIVVESYIQQSVVLPTNEVEEQIEQLWREQLSLSNRVTPLSSLSFSLHSF